MSDKPGYITQWLNICCVLVFLMVLIGGVTRLTQSGLSMVDWRPLVGIIPPITQNQWEESFDKYKEYPEYQKINKYKLMDLSQYKRIFYWEYLHRIFGRIIGLFYIIPFIIFLRKGYISSRFIKPIIFAILLIILQGLLGWYMVKSGLVDNPNVSHFRLAAHLFLAFFLIAYTFWIKLSIEYNKEENSTYNPNFNYQINLIIILFVCQIIFGAFIAGTKAGLLWNTFPLIEGKLVPSGLFALQPLYNNFINNLKMFQFIHRILGMILLLFSGYFYYTTKDTSYNNECRFLFMLLLIQFYIGVMTLLLRVPVFMGILHQSLALILLLIITKIKFLISRR